jgi:hypothetical protein
MTTTIVPTAADVTCDDGRTVLVPPTDSALSSRRASARLLGALRTAAMAQLPSPEPASDAPPKRILALCHGAAHPVTPDAVFVRVAQPSLLVMQELKTVDYDGTTHPTVCADITCELSLDHVDALGGASVFDLVTFEYGYNGLQSYPAFWSNVALMLAPGGLFAFPGSLRESASRLRTHMDAAGLRPASKWSKSGMIGLVKPVAAESK